MSVARARLRAPLLSVIALVVILLGATHVPDAAAARLHARHCAHRRACSARRPRTASRVDRSAVVLTGKPAAATSADTATFAWQSSTRRPTHCELDDGGWQPCRGTVSYSGLSAGAHSFAVRTASGAGYTVVSDNWTVTTASASAPTSTRVTTSSATPAAAPATATSAPTASTVATTTTPVGSPSSTTTVTTASSPATATANSFGAGIPGIAAGGALQNEDPATLAQDLALDQSAGAKWLRIDINWAQIQAAGPNSYNWTNIDRVVTGAEADGMSVLGVIVYTPAWARPAGSQPTYGPSASQYAAFAQAAAAHYSALGVQAYEIWNEENNAQFWTPAPNAAAYTSLLQAAYPAIKNADPNATVVTGGLAPEPDDGTDIAPTTFLQDVYADGGQGSFDAVGMHPYCAPALPGDAQGWSAWYQTYGTATSLRSIMVANGDGAKKIWGTEFGSPSSGQAGVSPTTQAETVTRAYQLWSSYSWAGPLFFYQGRDSGNDPSNASDTYGFATQGFSLKPSYYAYQAAAAAL